MASALSTSLLVFAADIRMVQEVASKDMSVWLQPASNHHSARLTLPTFAAAFMTLVSCLRLTDYASNLLIFLRDYNCMTNLMHVANAVQGADLNVIGLGCRPAFCAS